jgi:imidazolonepropionase-like amidohydrolase
MTSGVDALAQIQAPFSYAFYEAARNLRATLATGITTVRDAGGADLGVKTAVERGLVEGPRMLIAVNALSQTGGHGDDWTVAGFDVPLFTPHPGRPRTVVDGPEEVRRAVRLVLRAGADVVKVHTTGGVLSPTDDPAHAQFSPEELAVLVAEASAQGKAVLAHAQGAAGIANAVRAGVRSVEHGIFLDDEGIELMLERGTWLVPTLVAPRAVLAAAAAGAAVPENVVAKAAAVTEAHAASFARAVAAGVKVAMGTDSGVGPHGENLAELPLMAAGGMGAAQVLAATTSSGAELLGLDDVGRLRPGARGDVVVVDGALEGPGGLDDLRSRVRGVWKDGVRASPDPRGAWHHGRS